MYYYGVMFCFLRESESQICSKEILNHQLCLQKPLLNLSMLQTASGVLFPNEYRGWFTVCYISNTWRIGINHGSLLRHVSCIIRLWIFIWWIITLCEILRRKSKITCKLADFNYKDSSAIYTERSGKFSLCRFLPEIWQKYDI